MSHSHDFHFTIGPVQGFVAQARRTRDFWAGSFLLSYLSGVAMAATRQLAGKDAIQFPLPDPVFLDAIAGKELPKEALPTQGSIPNRFKAKVPKSFDGNQVVEAVQKAWQGLASAIWEKDLAPLKSDMAEVIWHEQVSGFWEISWVTLNEQQQNLPAMDMRKNWRTHLPAPQEGRKCSLMEGWQELSGHLSPQKKERELFWKRVQQATHDLDIQDGEALCAMSFIKRRFAHYFSKLCVDSGIPDLKLHGWQIPKSVPSVALLAAEPTLATLCQSLNDECHKKLQAFTHAWQQSGGKFGEKENLPTSIQAAAKKLELNLGLDGSAWHPMIYENASAYGLNAYRAKLAKEDLKALYQSAELAPPSPFYAVLMMDGDSLGKQMSDTGKQTGISQALNQFTLGVKQLVEAHNGFLIYAGGDDVLALLPMESAINSAICLRQKYNECFKLANAELNADTAPITTSISAAILFNHIKTPLSKILHEAHEVLDNHAKEGAGRDAIAIRVTKQSGVNLSWAQPWEHALSEDQQSLQLQVMAQQLFNMAQGGSIEASSSFLYQIRTHIDRLTVEPKQFDAALNNLLSDLIAVDYVNSGINSEKSIQSAKAKTQSLLEQCTPHYRHVNGAETNIKPSGSLSIDGALLALFIATKGHFMAGDS